MKKTTKQFLGIAAASALVISVASGVFAHGGFGPGFGPGWGGHHGMMGGPGGMHGPGGGPGWMMGGDPFVYADQQLTGLKSTLGITVEQEDAWNTYEEAVKGKVGVMLSHRQTMFGSGTIAPEQRFTFHQQGLEQMQKVTAASRGLYAVLTPAQQERAGNLIGLHHGLR
ncbi:hypothetical protein DJ031_05730 [bacterium endosymbiont of Escarpia laminata]|nr:MAG: hypothetical protein DJ031_05730 [bacterium endosymbiont of Escarpia laminata]